MDSTPTAAVQGAEPLTGSSAGSVTASIRDRADPRLVLADRVEQLYSQMWLGILMTFAIGGIATFELWEQRLKELVLFWWVIVLVITASSAGKSAPRMSSIILRKLASSVTRRSGITSREWWCVTPQGRMASNSGCTEVLVEGASTPNLARAASESGMRLECHSPFQRRAA